MSCWMGSGVAVGASVAVGDGSVVGIGSAVGVAVAAGSGVAVAVAVDSGGASVAVAVAVESSCAAGSVAVDALIGSPSSPPQPVSASIHSAATASSLHVLTARLHPELEPSMPGAVRATGTLAAEPSPAKLVAMSQLRTESVGVEDAGRSPGADAKIERTLTCT